MLPILYLGMRGTFSLVPLTRLVAAGVPVVGVVVPAPSDAREAIRQLRPFSPSVSDLPLLTPYVQPNIIHFAWQHGIPVYEVADLREMSVLMMLQLLQPAVACVVCFSKRIPKVWLDWPTYGFWNVHPSLLPAYRGPEPLFWLLREGGQAGVTVHQMDTGLDTGAILAQRPLTLPDGLSGEALDHLCAEVGAELLLTSLIEAERGQLTSRIQSGGRYHASPTDADFRITAVWSVRRAFNFMRGTAEWGRPYQIEVGGEVVVAKTAVSFTVGRVLLQPVIKSGNEWGVQLADGVLFILPK